MFTTSWRCCRLAHNAFTYFKFKCIIPPPCFSPILIENFSCIRIDVSNITNMKILLIPLIHRWHLGDQIVLLILYTSMFFVLTWMECFEEIPDMLFSFSSSLKSHTKFSCGVSNYFRCLNLPWGILNFPNEFMVGGQFYHQFLNIFLDFYSIHFTAVKLKQLKFQTHDYSHF